MSASGVSQMPFEDKSLICKDCGSEFVFTEGEQEFFASKGFENLPVRCKACRDSRKSRMGYAGNSEPREMFPAVCADCAAETTVPFRPSLDKPVFCSACFAARRQAR